MSNPGWYPDPEGGRAARWWDGAQWTTHVSPYQTPEVLTAPAGTKTGTIWIWLIVLLPLLSYISLFTIDWNGYVQSMVGSPSGSLGAMLTPGYLISVGVGWVLYGLMVVFAVLDWRTLKARGIPQPFHWAFAFISLVYPIGRSIVVKRRTGSGLGPLWGVIAVFVFGIIASIVLMIHIFQVIDAYVLTTIH